MRSRPTLQGRPLDGIGVEAAGAVAPRSLPIIATAAPIGGINEATRRATSSVLARPSLAAHASVLITSVHQARAVSVPVRSCLGVKGVMSTVLARLATAQRVNVSAGLVVGS